MSNSWADGSILLLGLAGEHFMYLSLWKDEARMLPLEQSLCSAMPDGTAAAAAPSCPATSPGWQQCDTPRLGLLQYGTA